MIETIVTTALAALALAGVVLAWAARSRQRTRPVHSRSHHFAGGEGGAAESLFDSGSDGSCADGGGDAGGGGDGGGGGGCD